MPVPSLVPAPPALATAIFGERIELATRYAGWLLGPGVERGLVGPRESDRVWERHVVNCAALVPLIAAGSSVVDIGSGAGLPGIAIAIARPDLQVALIESMARRTAFLDEVVADLGLPNVSVRRARAEDVAPAKLNASVVTARAVAPLRRLAALASPLLSRDGRLLALKGEAAQQEVTEGWGALRSAGFVGGVEIVAVNARPDIDGAGMPSNALNLTTVARWSPDGTSEHLPAPDGDGRLALVVKVDRFPQAATPTSRIGLG